jgi:NTE family protein
MKENTCNVNDFLESTIVKECVEKVLSLKDKQFSDVVDKEGHQYVHLVQKGGGMLGIALLGYTYILETLGIRFLKTAGTSAGAINTALITIMGDKSEAKSVKILEKICKADFFDFVDGNFIFKFFFKLFISNKKRIDHLKKKYSKILTWTVCLILLAPFMGDLIFLGIRRAYPQYLDYALLSFEFSGLILLILILTVSFSLALFHKLKNAGYGINPGDAFWDWLNRIFDEYGILDLDQLEEKAMKAPEDMEVRLEISENWKRADKAIYDESKLAGGIILITTELVTQNKIQLPEMKDLFWSKEDQMTHKPADLVRASMAIPLFFESFYVPNIQTIPDIDEKWKKTFGIEKAPESARLVDGGVLSNFPISIFYERKVTVPRLPVFGINLDDSKTEADLDKNRMNTLSQKEKTNAENNPKNWNLGDYAGKIFAAAQNNSDNDFLQKNRAFGLGVGTVPLNDFNYLNFAMSNEEKIRLFEVGARAATKFLIAFDWKDYKDKRAKI